MNSFTRGDAWARSALGRRGIPWTVGAA